MEYRKGYVKALTDMYNLLERQECVLKERKINKTDMVRKIIKFCIENVDVFIAYGEMIEFYYCTAAGKRTVVERTELLTPKQAKSRI